MTKKLALVLALMIATPVGATQIIGGDLIGGSTILGLDTGQALPDWSSLLSAVWYFEETATPLLDTGDDTTSDDFAWISTVTTQTGTVFEGSRAGDTGTAGTEYFECANKACLDTVVSDGTVQLAYGCRIYRSGTSASGTALISNYHFSLPEEGGSGWRMSMRPSTDLNPYEIRCQLDRSAAQNGDVTEDSEETVAQNVWTTVDCHVDDTDNDTNGQLHAYQDGALNNSNPEFTGGATEVGATADARIGDAASVGTIEFYDECYFDQNYEWVAADFCRRCSCGIKGEFCRCDASTPANFHSCSTNADCGGAPAICSAGGTCAGYHNSAQCDNCTLTACNKANPG